jgi:hypothetical protein
MTNLIDIDFDFRKDTPFGNDPDLYSPTLRQYHKILWNKKLPNGKTFNLTDTVPKIYLYHHSELGEFYLSSDSAIHTFSQWKSMEKIISQFDATEIEEFRHLSYTIGGMLIFPSNRINGKSTINGAKGFNPLIKDRIDLTLECIRRFYLNEASPLSEVLTRYADFFSLFDSFAGYIEFFLLQDTIDSHTSQINFFMPFNDFKTPALPTSVDQYSLYKDLSMIFVNKRNKRILQSVLA